MTDGPPPRRPSGRDRLEAAPEGLLVLGSPRPKPWRPREEGTVTLPGTAVRWDDDLFEVVAAEATPSGGHRYTLAPWDERLLVRSIVVYGEAEAATGAFSRPGAAPAVPPVATVPVVAPVPVAGAGPEAEAASPVPARPAPAARPDPPSAPSRRPAGGRGLLAAVASIPPGPRALLLGGLPALALGWFLPFRIMGEGMSALVHELGHTAAAWLVGRAAVPAVVLTISFGQSRAAAALVWAILACAAYRFRRVPRAGPALIVAAAIYPFVAFTRLETDLFDAGGHLLEAIAAAWFLRRALVGGLFKEAERPLWAFFGTYLLARNGWLFLRIAFSPEARTDYLTIAVAGENDLVKLAHRWGASLEATALVALVVTLAIPAAVLLLAARAPVRRDA